MLTRAILKAILAMENFALFVEFRVFNIEFLKNHSVHWAQVFRDNLLKLLCSFQYSEVLFYYPHQIMMSNVNEAKTVNKIYLYSETCIKRTPSGNGVVSA